MSLIDVTSLTIGIGVPDGRSFPVVDAVDLSVDEGESLGIAGESGSGKSTLLLAMMGLVKTGLRHLKGQSSFDGMPMLGRGDEDLNDIRGGRLALIPQNAGTALTPSMRIGRQIDESLRLHGSLSADARNRRIVDLLARVQLPDPANLARRYPHQLSGGQLQRVAIAMALAGEPKALLLDEPTTGLDVTTQLGLLELLTDLRRSEGVALICVSHDLGVIAHLCHRLAVMYAGSIVETGGAAEILAAPRHPYSRALIASIPRIADGVLPQSIPGRPPAAADRTKGCNFAPRCAAARDACLVNAPALQPIAKGHQVACFFPTAGPLSQHDAVAMGSGAAGRPVLRLVDVSVSYQRLGLLGRFSGPPRPTVNKVSLSVGHGEVLGLVGESGSGKSTVLRAIAGLWPISGGEIVKPGNRGAGRSPEGRRAVQLIFQNPDASLNPRHTIEEIIAQPLRLYFDMKPAEIRDTARRLLTEVNLDPRYLARYPGQLSGGERQRVAIARAFAARPEVLLCDEITSALDVSVQASVLRLIRDLGTAHGVATLLVSHDLAAVRALSHRIAVLYRGEIVEIGPAADVCDAPMHPYTKALLAAVLEPEVGGRHSIRFAPDRRDIQNPACAFAPRCPDCREICTTTRPEWRGNGHEARCHLADDQRPESRLSV
jgi:peptide/nickel transport system ATP-binding protein